MSSRNTWTWKDVLTPVSFILITGLNVVGVLTDSAFLVVMGAFIAVHLALYVRFLVKLNRPSPPSSESGADRLPPDSSGQDDTSHT